MACTPQELVTAASCYTCIDGLEEAVALYLLCAWAGGTPTPPATGPLSYNSVGWWAADSYDPPLADTTAIGGAQGDPLNWEDLTGNMHYGYGTVASQRPVYRTNQFGSMPAIYYNGKVMLMNNGPLSVPCDGAFTFMIVMKWGGTSTMLIGLNDAQNFFGRFPSWVGIRFGVADVQHTASPLSAGVGTAVCYTVTRGGFDGATGAFYENKTFLNTWSTLCPIGEFGMGFVGGNGSGTVDDVYIGEMIWFENQFTLGEITDVYDNWLKPRWGLP